jgi:N-glycosylase/DNA lyase
MPKFVNDLLRTYVTKRSAVKKRLQEFKHVFNESDERLFAELCFCICTPQSKAKSCDLAINALLKNNYLFTGNAKQIRPFMNAVRFADNKTSYIVEARNFFTEGEELTIKERITSFSDVFKLREWLVENVKGFGMKEASHFLRNIGMGDNIAILDRHILKNLYEYGVIDEVPECITKKLYLEIEEKMRVFSKTIGIPLDELDLIFWSEETGVIFK